MRRTRGGGGGGGRGVMVVRIRTQGGAIQLAMQLDPLNECLNGPFYDQYVGVSFIPTESVSYICYFFFLASRFSMS